MAAKECKSCGHEPHRGPCFPSCPECTNEPSVQEPSTRRGASEPGGSRDAEEQAGEAASGDVGRAHGGADREEGPGETGQVARNRRWREKNRERYNEYMREYRRTKK